MTSVNNTANHIRGRHILAIQDTTEINYQGHHENAIYEFLDRIPNKKTHLLIRSKSNRLVLGNNSLSLTLEEQPVQKKYYRSPIALYLSEHL